MVTTIIGSITDIKEGIICQQVNCQNAYGRGVSGVISKKWPIVARDYHNSFKTATKQELFGTYREIEIVPDKLYACNLYTQFFYGNAYRTKQKYTDKAKLVDALGRVCVIGTFKGLQVYIPYGIGCGLGGEKWEVLEKELNEPSFGFEIIAVKLPTI